MNRENLKKMAEYIATIPHEQFNMNYYNAKTDCGTVGCVIGHCVAIDSIENRRKCFDNDFFCYDVWSEQFTGLGFYSQEWLWCFDFLWSDIDNTPQGAAKRIGYLLENGLPDDWQKQQKGDAPLCYL